LDDRLRCSLTDSNEWAYAWSSLAAFSDMPEWLWLRPADDVLFMEQRLVCELEGDSVLLDWEV
jgi:hypothetical protein